jgi:hypothetical protein
MPNRLEGKSLGACDKKSENGGKDLPAKAQKALQFFGEAWQLA